MNRLQRFLPFLAWAPLTPEKLRADAVAGITVALVLIPQSMAYAQLAGMPPWFGLYAAFLPVIVGALFGSSNQLATGPVAMVSLLTGSALVQFAAAGSPEYIALAVLLALIVGVMQLGLGVLHLGAVVSFLSHPVIVGFTNGAAIIIFLSQLNKLLGVPIGRSEHFLGDVWGVVRQLPDAHWPSVGIGLLAFAIMWGLRRRFPRLPGVLIAVAITTALSWATGFERNATVPIDAIADAEVRALAAEIGATEARVAEIARRIAAKSAEIAAIDKAGGDDRQHRLALRYEIDLMRLESADAERENRTRRRALRKFVFERTGPSAGAPGTLLLSDQVAPGTATDGRHWRIQRVQDGRLLLTGGGEVVGNIPSGIPSFKLPAITWDMVVQLFSTALVITLVGFMEAISVAKAMATKTRQRIDPDQELVGQGLANIVGSLTQAFPVSGSFSRSAVNLAAGARTGMSAIFTFVLVLVTLLHLTPLLYHLPQAVLAAVIMMAALSLINFGAMQHAWHAHRHDGIAAGVTFAATLGFAPHLDTGILVGGGLAITLYLYRTMSPRVAILGRHPDGTLRDAALHEVATSDFIVVLRFDGSLYFANVPYFEDTLLGAVASRPKARHVLIVADGINQLDASGEEVVRHLIARLRDAGITVAFSGAKRQVLQVMRNTGLYDLIGPQHFHRTEEQALEAIRTSITDPEYDPSRCPLTQRSAAGVERVSG